MRKTATLTIAFLLTAGALVPAAAAGWKYRGMNEPDTDRDVNDGLMFQTPDQAAGPPKVYFNGFAHESLTWINPNAAAAGSRMQPGVDAIDMSALLGLWKDCNRDGYIGNSELGLFEYRSELLIETDLCPRTPVPANCTSTGTPATAPACPTPYPFNDGGWVREFIWIGNRLSPVNPTYVNVPGTAVWFDFGRPEDQPGTTCPLLGSMSPRSTGAMLEWGDCFTRFRGVDTLNQAQDISGLPVGGWDKSDVEESDATLNLDNPAWVPLYGEDGQGWSGAFGRDNQEAGTRPDRAVTVWDCQGDASAPDASPQVNPSGSVYEPANETYNIATKNGDCKTEGTTTTSNNALPWPNLNGEAESTNAFQGKDAVSDYMVWTAGNRKQVPAQVPIGPFAPHDLGLAVERDLDTVGSSWKANTRFTMDPQFVDRGTLTLSTARYLTFYASLGSTSGLNLPASVVMTYGGHACDAGETGISDGWNCDGQAWKDRCVLDDVLASQCIIVRKAYNLRDIDCWDGQVARGVPVYASSMAVPQELGGNPPCAASQVPPA